jgi:predicted chitinase
MNLGIIKDTPLVELPSAQRAELNLYLTELGYFYPTLEEGWAKFKSSHYMIAPTIIGIGSAKLIAQAYSALTTKEGVISAIKTACDSVGLGLLTQKAYVVATVKHETNDTFKPVREAYWLSEDWRRKNLRYYPYYGRGYAQITWEANYKKFGDRLGVDFVKEPDRVMLHRYALPILIYGFKDGLFTSKKLTDYVTATKTDYYNARKCINALDRAGLVETYAEEYYAKWK